MKEQLISFETAKLAKEKGWNYHSSSFCYNDLKLTIKDPRNHHFFLSMMLQLNPYYKNG